MRNLAKTSLFSLLASLAVFAACLSPAPAAGAEYSEDALARIVAARKVVNVHEHVQGEKNAEALLAAMDANGIEKTVLMGSSYFTFALYERAGFTRYDDNNEAILAMAAKYPGRFDAWPTVKPEDPAMVAKIEDLVARGAKGVKLYLGHGYTSRRSNRYMFHTMALDDPRMLPLYAFCEESHVPMCMHVNSDKPGLADEFLTVLKRYPNLKVNCPHFMMSSSRISRLREYLDTFPNLYADISFGHDDFLKEGFERISRSSSEFKALFRDYPERFFFGTDFVFSDFRPHDASWSAERIGAYYSLLTKGTFTTPLVRGKTLNGLELPPETLENVLFRNFERFMALKPVDTRITREINWRNMRVRSVERAPGEMLPPEPERSYWSSRRRRR